MVICDHWKYKEVGSVGKERYTKNTHKLDEYENSWHTHRFVEERKGLYTEKDSRYYNGSIDDFEKQNPDLAAQCRQFLAKF